MIKHTQIYDNNYKKINRSLSVFIGYLMSFNSKYKEIISNKINFGDLELFLKNNLMRDDFSLYFVSDFIKCDYLIDEIITEYNIDHEFLNTISNILEESNKNSNIKEIIDGKIKILNVIAEKIIDSNKEDSEVWKQNLDFINSLEGKEYFNSMTKFQDFYLDKNFGLLFSYNLSFFQWIFSYNLDYIIKCIGSDESYFKDYNITIRNNSERELLFKEIFIKEISKYFEKEYNSVLEFFDYDEFFRIFDNDMEKVIINNIEKFKNKNLEEKKINETAKELGVWLNTMNGGFYKNGFYNQRLKRYDFEAGETIDFDYNYFLHLYDEFFLKENDYSKGDLYSFLNKKEEEIKNNTLLDQTDITIESPRKQLENAIYAFGELFNVHPIEHTLQEYLDFFRNNEYLEIQSDTGDYTGILIKIKKQD